MKIRLKQEHSQKQKLSSTLKSWLPILQADLESLVEVLEPFKKENPFIDIKVGNEKPDKKFQRKDFFQQLTKDSVSDSIEALTIDKKSLYDTLNQQINPPLFPTPKSQEIAYAIIENLDNEGYFIDDSLREMEKKLGYPQNEIEKIRERFAYLEPSGIGAKNFKESFLFQLYDLDISEELYNETKKLIENFENIENYSKDKLFHDALKIIKKFRNPPGIDFLEEQKQIIPDIFVFTEDDNIEVKLNDTYYPDIILDTEGLDSKHEFVSKKIKDAKDLIDALNMRKATLYKIGLLIVDYQYDFFFGKEMKPMKLKDLAVELDRNPSTISRAISGKYLACNRGVIPLKSFFTTAVEDDISNNSIKEYMLYLVKNEDKNKPLSDLKILTAIEKKFGIKMARRTITKYRKQFNIAGSSERKKLYTLNS